MTKSFDAMRQKSIGQKKQSTPSMTLTLGELLALDISPPVDLLGEWLHANTITMIHGPAGIGKSWFSLSIAMAIAGGGKFGSWQAPKPAKVIYVDGEMGEETLQRMAIQLRRVIKGLDKNDADDNLILMPPNFTDDAPNERFIDAMGAAEFYIEKVIESGAALIVFDNIRTLTLLEDENSAVAWRGMSDALKRLREHCAVVILHHDNKTNGYSGSSSALTVLNKQIQLKPLRFQESMEDCGASFEVRLHKCREQRVDTLDGVTLGLSSTLGWRIRNSRIETKILDQQKLVDMANTGNYKTQDELAEAFGVTRQTISSKFKAIKKEMKIDLVARLADIREGRFEKPEDELEYFDFSSASGS